MASILAFAAVAAMLSIALRYRDGVATHPPMAQKPLTPINGKLAIKSLDDLRVGSSKIQLCGVANQRPLTLQALLLEAAKAHFQDRTLSCNPVGLGTPCDGRTAATFANVPVVQCRLEDGTDLAAELARLNILCDLPHQSGGIYRACG